MIQYWTGHQPTQKRRELIELAKHVGSVALSVTRGWGEFR